MAGKAAPLQHLIFNLDIGDTKCNIQNELTELKFSTDLEKLKEKML